MSNEYGCAYGMDVYENIIESYDNKNFDFIIKNNNYKISFSLSRMSFKNCE